MVLIRLQITELFVSTLWFLRSILKKLKNSDFQLMSRSLMITVIYVKNLFKRQLWVVKKRVKTWGSSIICYKILIILFSDWGKLEIWQKKELRFNRFLILGFHDLVCSKRLSLNLLLIFQKSQKIFSLG